mgnify:CR=1 FL=1
MELHEARQAVAIALDAMRVYAEQVEARAQAALRSVDAAKVEAAELEPVLAKKRDAEAALADVLARSREALARAEKAQATLDTLKALVK